MKVRIHTLWRMPVYCMAASYISALVTVYLGGYFFLTRTPGADGVTVSIDPVRSMIFDGVLFLIVLLVGGFWIFRSMTKMELGISAGITIGIYLLLALAQRFIPGFQPGVTEAFIYTWQGNLRSIIWKLTDQAVLARVISYLAPLLFIPFGRKRED